MELTDATARRDVRDCASELKFLIPPEKVAEVRRWAHAHLAPDPHGTGDDGDTYRVTSLYFDTAAFDVFRGNGSYGRSKYRVRRYNGDSVVFLERKTKRGEWVCKRRTPVKIELLRRLEEREADVLWSGFWFHRRLLGRQLTPVCQIDYLRTARIGTAEGSRVRLTLDREIHARRIDVQAYDDTSAHTPLSQQDWILELKFQTTLPTLFKRLIADLSPAPRRISKYRLAVSTLRLLEQPDVPQAPRRSSECDYA